MFANCSKVIWVTPVFGAARRRGRPAAKPAFTTAAFFRGPDQALPKRMTGFKELRPAVGTKPGQDGGSVIANGRGYFASLNVERVFGTEPTDETLERLGEECNAIIHLLIDMDD